MAIRSERAGRFASLICFEKYEENGIEGVHFEGVSIYGPSVMLPTNTEFTDCAFGHPRGTEVEDMYWEGEVGKMYVGVVGVDRCIFRGCRFFDIGIVSLPEDRERWLDAFRGSD